MRERKKTGGRVRKTPSIIQRNNSMEQQLQVAIIGGTGDQGKGLALRWANAGFAVTIGSRDAARASRRKRIQSLVNPPSHLTARPPRKPRRLPPSPS
jgi:hypothetical protein